MVNNKKYYAFISYSHKDEEWAKWLQHEFEHYHFPTTLDDYSNLPDKFRPIFRDVDELSGGELHPQITAALRASAYLVVICSTNSAKSEYVDNEIKEFIEIGKQEGINNIANIFPLIIDGIPNTKENSDEECFPRTLRTLPSDLIAGDATKHGREHAFVKVLSGTLRNSGITFSVLWNQFERDRIEEERKERERKDKLLSVQSRFLAEKANNLIDNHDYDVANLIALEALPKNLAEPDRPCVREAEEALRKSSIYTSPIIRSSLSGQCIQTNGKVVITEEGDFNLKVWNVKNGIHIKTLYLGVWLKEYYADMLESHEIDLYVLSKYWLKSIAFPDRSKNVIHLYTFDSVISIDLDGPRVTPKILFKRKNTEHHTHTAEIVFSYDGNYYIWKTTETSGKVSISLYETITNEKLLDNSAFAESSIAFSPNNNLVAFTCQKDVHIFDIKNLKSNNKGYLAKYRCYDPSFCAFVDDETIIVVRGNKSVELWNFVSKEVEIIYTSDTDIIDIVDRYNILALVTSSKQIKVLDVKNKIIISSLDWNTHVKLLSFSDNGDTIYFRNDNSLRIWDYHICSDGSRILYWHTDIIHCVACSRDMSYIVSVSENCVKLWDIEHQRIIKSFALEFQENLEKVVVSKNHDKIFISGDQLYCIEITSGNINTVAREKVCNLCISSDEKYLLNSTDNIITLYDIESLSAFKEIILPDDQNLLWGVPIAFHPKETIMVIASQNIIDYDIITLTILDYEKETPITSIEIHDCLEIVADNAVCFSDNGEAVILSAFKEDIYKWYFKTNFLSKLDSQSNNERQTTNNTIESDGCFVVLREHLSLQELIDKTRESLGVLKLTSDERSRYYLD